MHKFVSKALVQASVLFLFGSVVYGQEEGVGPYFRVEAGPQIQQDMRLESVLGLPSPNSKLKLNPGARFDLGLGYNFYSWFAVEGETGMLYNSLDKITGPGGEASVDDVNLWQVPFLVNAVFTIPLQSRFKPYLGVGAGELWSMVDGHDIESNDDFSLAYQGQAGVNYVFNEYTDLGLGYKILYSRDHDLGAFKAKESYAHSLLFSVTFKY